jgi:hypothetical protein
MAQAAVEQTIEVPLLVAKLDPAEVEAHMQVELKTDYTLDYIHRHNCS